MSRRWLVLVIVTAAIVLVAGRILSSWYVDYNWFAINGATRLWWVKAINLSLLRIVAFLVASTFAFINLFAVRSSVKSLRMPRRMGNLEFSEEVSARILNRSVLAMSVVIQNVDVVGTVLHFEDCAIERCACRRDRVSRNEGYLAFLERFDDAVESR